jgi:hypothetical protein
MFGPVLPGCYAYRRRGLSIMSPVRLQRGAIQSSRNGTVRAISSPCSPPRCSAIRYSVHLAEVAKSRQLGLLYSLRVA